jgi:hypothetical protein
MEQTRKIQQGVTVTPFKPTFEDDEELVLKPTNIFPHKIESRWKHGVSKTVFDLKHDNIAAIFKAPVQINPKYIVLEEPVLCEIAETPLTMFLSKEDLCDRDKLTM